MKDYVNWAVLAPGRIARSMADAMTGEEKAGNSKIRRYAVASRSKERADEFAAAHNFQKSYGSYDALFDDPDVDAVYIANPHAFHLEAAISALRSGKHVLCEKPAGCSLSQLDKMTGLARKNGLFFMEAMWTACNPCLAKVRAEISAGTIGNIMSIDSRFCNRNPYDPADRNYAPELAGGALLDLGIYNIYFAMMMTDFSPVIKTSSAVRMRGGVDVWNAVSLAFANGAVTNFQSAMDLPSTVPTHNAVIYGEKGFITMENFFMAQRAEIRLYKNIWGCESEVVRVIDEPFRTNGYEYELSHATDCILAGKPESDIHTHQKSRDLCAVMDSLRADWGMKYPWEA